MTKRTRLFVFIAAGILVVGLGTGLVASYANLQDLVFVGQDGPAELAYVPAEARFLAYANVRDVMDSELRRKLSQLDTNSPRGPEKFREETGIDLEQDVDRIVATAWESGATQSSAMPGRPLLLARGRFDEVRIEGLVREKGGTVEDYKGRRLLAHGDGEFAVSFLEPGLVGVGTVDAVRRAIDTKDGSSNVRSNDELMGLVRDIDDGTAWAVARFDAMAGVSGLPPDVASKLPAINWFAASGILDGGVRGMVRVEARDETAAQDLREVIRGFIALARMQAGQQAELAELLNSLELGGQGKTVSLGFAVPPEMIDALGALRAQRRRDMPQAAPQNRFPGRQRPRQPVTPAL